MGRENREVWAKRVERWRDSGLTAKKFAEETGVNAKTLAYWKWRLGRAIGAGAARRAARPRPRRVGRVRAVPFVEVSPASVPAASPVPEQRAGEAEPFEIALPSGLRVRVPARFDEGALARLLQAVR
ncbi:MAG: IS66 family insertion sequence element accessory protein TnpB [Thermodesulfobacteriota bacterium]